ncbi:unnamed protein product, partial [Mesorhabditis belari]|uniref:Uncharacterized protein n=1 Tax=Mesorhabditis belari TaxID=2138241 RepID=A0AAF3EUL1_9BILA
MLADHFRLEANQHLVCPVLMMLCIYALPILLIFFAKVFFFAEKGCKSGKKALETEETSEEEILPKPIHRTEKAEVIVRKNDYPTFNDILSDWESKSKQSASRKSEMKLGRDLMQEGKKENLAD